MEGAAAPIHGDLLCGRIPTESQARVDFATFLALMYARTPAMRRMSAEAHGRGLQIMSYAHASDDTVFESTIKRLEKERGEPIDGEMKERLRQAMLDPSDYVMEVPKEYTLSALNLADSLAPVFFKMKWTIVLAAQGFFVTSGQSHVRQVDRRTIIRSMGITDSSTRRRR